MDFFMSSSRLIPPETFTARQRMRTAHVRFPWRPRHRRDRIGRLSIRDRFYQRPVEGTWRNRRERAVTDHIPFRNESADSAGQSEPVHALPGAALVASTRMRKRRRTFCILRASAPHIRGPSISNT
jgi:hypothetical protein